MRHMLLAAIAALSLTGCNPGAPSSGDIASALGVSESSISDVSCTSANGSPGYTCSFIFSTPTTGYGILQRGQSTPLTRRFVKGDNGNWRAF